MAVVAVPVVSTVVVGALIVPSSRCNRRALRVPTTWAMTKTSTSSPNSTAAAEA